MLKSDKGRLVIEGKKTLLLAELTHLISSLVENEVFDKDDLETSVKLALMSDDELNEAVEKKRKEESELDEQAAELFMKALEALFK